MSSSFVFKLTTFIGGNKIFLSILLCIAKLIKKIQTYNTFAINYQQKHINIDRNIKKKQIRFQTSRIRGVWKRTILSRNHYLH